METTNDANAAELPGTYKAPTYKVSEIMSGGTRIPLGSFKSLDDAMAYCHETRPFVLPFGGSLVIKVGNRVVHTYSSK